MSKIDEKKLQEWMDKAAITEALARYCRGVDRCDLEMVRSLYHEDAIDDHGIWKGPAFDFADFIVERGKTSRRTLHYVSNVYIELRGPDKAVCEAYWASVKETDGLPDFVGGRYLDTFERRNGEWKVSDRLIIFDIDRTDPVTGPFGGELRKGFTWGVRDRTEPYYAR